LRGLGGATAAEEWMDEGVEGTEEEDDDEAAEIVAVDGIATGMGTVEAAAAVDFDGDMARDDDDDDYILLYVSRGKNKKAKIVNAYVSILSPRTHWSSTFDADRGIAGHRGRRGGGAVGPAGRDELVTVSVAGNANAERDEIMILPRVLSSRPDLAKPFKVLGCRGIITLAIECAAIVVLIYKQVFDRHDGPSCARKLVGTANRFTRLSKEKKHLLLK